MRLITYDRGGARRLGAWVGETVVDLPEAVGHPAFPATMEALVQHIGGSILEAAHDVLDDHEVIDECTVVRPSILPALDPPPRSITFVTDRGVVRALPSGCFAAGLACIVGAGRVRRMNRHESRIFGYTLVIHRTNGNNGGATTSLGPCVVTPEHLNEAVLELHLRIDGHPSGVKTLQAPDRFFGRVMAGAAHDRPFEAGDVVARMCWTIDDSSSPATATPRVVELSAEQIGVLRAERPSK